MSLPIVTNENYFSPETEMAYMGSTQFKNFLSCEAAALAKVRGEWKEPPSIALMVGSYVDAYFSGEMDDFRAHNPEIFKRDGSLKSEYQAADAIIKRMESDRLYSLLMSGKKQTVRTGLIAGVPFKVKVDSLLDEETCRRIVQEFPDTDPVLGGVTGAIVDQKVMRGTEDVWSDEEWCKVPFWKGWGYDIQGAIYRAIVGLEFPFILAVGTKETPADLEAVHIPDDELTQKLYEIEDIVPRFQAIKEGREVPRRCGKCAYCRATKTLSRIKIAGDDCEDESPCFPYQ